MLYNINIENSYRISLIQNKFIMNQASRSGGALKFDMLLPLANITANNIFQDNKSPYGPDLASYPIRIAINSS